MTNKVEHYEIKEETTMSEQNDSVTTMPEQDINDSAKKTAAKTFKMGFVIALVLFINVIWFLGVQFYVRPSLTDTISQQNAIIEEQNNYITQIQTDYTNNIAGLQTQIDAANAKITELQGKLQ